MFFLMFFFVLQLKYCFEPSYRARSQCRHNVMYFCSPKA